MDSRRSSLAMPQG